ncbi:MAG: 2OG-Fe(II) oxygenase [Deltaproteobacteria bacterium]
MSWWDRVKTALGAKPRARTASKQTWRLTWHGATLQLVAPHGTFRVKAIDPDVQLPLSGLAEGTELLCQGVFDGGHTIEDLVVTSATLAPPLLPRTRSTGTPTPSSPAPTPPEKSVTFERLRAALDALESVRWCEGLLAPAKLSIAAGGESAALDDVAWLTAHAEPAPFGHAGETKLDAKVRSTLRLRARGAAKIGGLELARIVERIEEAFALDSHIDATLLDVLIYPPGGKFIRHKDTPRDPRQLGTLLVEVQVAHRGGDLVLAEGDDEHRVAWGMPGSGPRWVAFYGDVDHSVEEVESGTRVTLAYTLTASDRPRIDSTLAAHLDAIADAAIALVGDPAARPPHDELIVPCERLVVASNDRTEPFALATLRGHDGAIARTFERCGFDVSLIELVIQTDEEAEGFPETEEWGTYRLQRPIPTSLFENIDAVSYEDDSDTEEYGPMNIASIEPYLDGNGEVLEGRMWLVRRAAGAKLLYEGLYSVTGYFGNEAGDGFLYAAAALVLKLPA